MSEIQHCNGAKDWSTNDCKGSTRGLPYQITTCFLFAIENPVKDKQQSFEGLVEVQIERRLL